MGRWFAVVLYLATILYVGILWPTETILVLFLGVVWIGVLAFGSMTPEDRRAMEEHHLENQKENHVRSR